MPPVSKEYAREWRAKKKQEKLEMEKRLKELEEKESMDVNPPATIVPLEPLQIEPEPLQIEDAPKIEIEEPSEDPNEDEEIVKDDRININGFLLTEEQLNELSAKQLQQLMDYVPPGDEKNESAPVQTKEEKDAGLSTVVKSAVKGSLMNLLTNGINTVIIGGAAFLVSQLKPSQLIRSQDTNTTTNNTKQYFMPSTETNTKKQNTQSTDGMCEFMPPTGNLY